MNPKSFMISQTSKTLEVMQKNNIFDEQLNSQVKT